jgi:hypothetical protein
VGLFKASIIMAAADSIPTPVGNNPLGLSGE